MGGIGSGTWDRWGVKTTVEQCVTLDVNRLAKDGALRLGAWGNVCWGNGEGGAVAFRTVFGPAGGRFFQISYTLPDHDEGDPDEVVIPIRLQTTRPHLGGVRWWFTCPLIIGGIACERRVAKLYLPPSGRHFGCRTCHDLTYQSCQQAHQIERLLDDGRFERWMARLDRKIASLDRRLSSGSRPARTKRS